MHDGHLIQSSECGTAIKEYADDVLDHPVWDLNPKSTFDFNDRTALSGIIDQVYDYEAGGLKCRLSGFSHWRDYAKGFLRNVDGDGKVNAKAVISDLEPNAVYSFIVFQYARVVFNVDLRGPNGLIVNSQPQVTTTQSDSELTGTATPGTATASVEGKIIFELVRDSAGVHLSKIEIQKHFSLDACKAACVDPGNKDPNHGRPCVAVEYSTIGDCRLAYSCDSPAAKVQQDVHLLPELVFLEMVKRDTETSFASKTANGYYVMQTSAAYPGMCGSAPISTSNQLVLMVNAPASVRIFFVLVFFSFFFLFFFFSFFLFF